MGRIPISGIRGSQGHVHLNGSRYPHTHLQIGCTDLNAQYHCIIGYFLGLKFMPIKWQPGPLKLASFDLHFLIRRISTPPPTFAGFYFLSVNSGSPLFVHLVHWLASFLSIDF